MESPAISRDFLVKLMKQATLHLPRMFDEQKSLRDIITDIAFRKRRAAKARCLPQFFGAEAPKEVYQNCCQRIAAAFEDDGYRYSKSKKEFKRSHGDFQFSISFQSSRNNVAGELVALWIHGNVRSPQLKKWRREHRVLRPEFDGVAGGQIGNLRNKTGWLEWNLADPNRREQLISDAIRQIREITFPYFRVFENVSAACEALIAEDFPALRVVDLIDFLQCFGSCSQARAGACNFLARHPDQEDAYARALEQFSAKGAPNQMLTTDAEALAAASILHAWGDLRNIGSKQ